MKLEELREQIDALKENFYINDKRDNFHMLKIMYYDEDEENYTTLVGSENIYVMRDGHEIYWIKIRLCHNKWLIFDEK